MIFAEFYQLSTGYVPGNYPGAPRFSPDHVKPIPACGSDSVLPLDGRFGVERQAQTARDVCKARGFYGFTLNAGRGYCDSRQTRALERVAPQTKGVTE